MAEKKVRMITQISGSRDGKAWPKPGETIALPAEEADQLLANGQAAELNAPEENARLDLPDVEVATPGNKSVRSQLTPAPDEDKVLTTKKVPHRAAAKKGEK